MRPALDTRHREPTFTVTHVLAARATPAEAAELKLAHDASVTRITGLPKMESQPPAHVVVAPPEATGALLRLRRGKVYPPISSMLYGQLNQRLREVRQVIAVAMANSSVARALRIRINASLLTIRRTYVTFDGTPVEAAADAVLPSAPSRAGWRGNVGDTSHADRPEPAEVSGRSETDSGNVPRRMRRPARRETTHPTLTEDRTMRKSRLAMCAAAALAIVLGAAPGWGEDLKIGAVGTLSGGGTEWGLALQRGVTVAFDEINTAGGVKVGGKSYTLKMIMYDDAYTAQGGTTAATRLVNVDNVKFIIGPVGSPPVLGVVAVTNPAKVIALSNGYSPKILTPESKYNFRIQLPTDYFAPAVAKWLRQAYPKVTKVGIISPNDAVGQTLAPLHVEAYNASKFDVVFDEKYDRGLKDFGPLLTRMMAKGAELLELDGNAPGEAGLMVKQARQLGFKGVIIQTGGPGLEEILRVAGPFAEGFLSYDLFDPSDPAVQGYVKGYRAKYEGPIPGISVMYYNAARILHEAFKKADSVDVEKVREALEKLEGAPTIFGPVRWTGKERYGVNHQLLHSFFVSEIKDGKVTVKARIEAGN